MTRFFVRNLILLVVVILVIPIAFIISVGRHHNLEPTVPFVIPHDFAHVRECESWIGAWKPFHPFRVESHQVRNSLTFPHPWQKHAIGLTRIRDAKVHM